MTVSITNDKKIDTKEINNFRTSVLDWYDKHRRTLPWRAEPGDRPDPYHVWLSEIMLQQTVVNAVIPYFLNFTEKWPTIEALANAPQDEIMNAWAGLGYYARARNLYKCAQVITDDYDGIFPKDQEELKKLPGIGDYTSAAITSIAFDKPATVIDGNIERVLARFFAIETPLPAGKKIIREHAQIFAQERVDRPGDYAQALMDIGASICIPKSPRCTFCPLSIKCRAKKKNIAAQLPIRAKKKPKPQKWGYIYWISNENGDILCEKRAESGMLGGMNGLPTSEWIEKRKHTDKPKRPHFLVSKKLSSPNEDLKISHSFTHFDLDLQGILYEIESKATPENYFWVSQKNIPKTAFPTLFKKFVNLICA